LHHAYLLGFLHCIYRKFEKFKKKWENQQNPKKWEIQQNTKKLVVQSNFFCFLLCFLFVCSFSYVHLVLVFLNDLGIENKSIFEIGAPKAKIFISCGLQTCPAPRRVHLADRQQPGRALRPVDDPCAPQGLPEPHTRQ
jgi:hypothetical protein